MALLWALRGATRRFPGHPVRPSSHEARRGERPGGEELSRLLLDDLAPAPRATGGLELLFGLSPCLLALRAARRRVARLLLQAGRSRVQGERAELLRAAEARDIPVLWPRRQKLDALCRHQVHQGVCMEVSPLRPRPWTEAGEARPGDDPQQLWLVLERLQDPRNLGAVLRSAHFLGVDKVITSCRNRHGRSLFPMCPNPTGQPTSSAPWWAPRQVSLSPLGAGGGQGSGLEITQPYTGHGVTLQLPAHSGGQQGQRGGYGGDGHILHR